MQAIINCQKIDFTYDFDSILKPTDTFKEANSYEEKLLFYQEFIRKIQPIYSIFKKNNFRKSAAQEILCSMDRKVLKEKMRIFSSVDPIEIWRFETLNQIKKELEDFSDTEIIASEMERLSDQNKVCLLLELPVIEYKKIKAYANITKNEHLKESISACESILNGKAEKEKFYGAFTYLCKREFEKNSNTTIKRWKYNTFIEDDVQNLNFLLHTPMFLLEEMEDGFVRTSKTEELKLFDQVLETEIQFEKRNDFTFTKTYYQNTHFFS